MRKLFGHLLPLTGDEVEAIWCEGTLTVDANVLVEQAKSSAKPVVLVTSERKEDWWERAHGKTIGPRQELLEEAHRIAGQGVILYQTDSFVERATKRTGDTFSALMRADICASRDTQQLEEAIDEVELTDLGPLDYKTCSMPFSASLHYTGDQLEDRMFCGTKIRAELGGTIAFKGRSWVVSEHDVARAEVERDEPDDLADEISVAQPGPSGPTRETTW